MVGAAHAGRTGWSRASSAPASRGCASWEQPRSRPGSARTSAAPATRCPRPCSRRSPPSSRPRCRPRRGARPPSTSAPGCAPSSSAPGSRWSTSSRCTRESPDLYSYRRDGAGAGRLAGVIRMTGMTREAEIAAAGWRPSATASTRPVPTRGRDPEEITLVVVTKFFPASDVRLLAELGVRDVGENRHQEAVEKAAECADLDLRWHFIGGLQSNKAAAVAAYADVVHSVDRAKLVAGLTAVPRSADVTSTASSRSASTPRSQRPVGLRPRRRARPGRADRGGRGPATARGDGGRAARRGPREAFARLAEVAAAVRAQAAAGDLDLGRHERRPRGGRAPRCDTPADRLCGPRSEARRQVMSEVPYRQARTAARNQPTSATRAEESTT